jgi:hypothetical protein
MLLSLKTEHEKSCPDITSGIERNDPKKIIEQKN